MYQPSSNRDYKGSRRLRSGPVLDFLTKLGGGNERILRQVPSGRGRFMQFAIMLVARLALATVLFSYALTVYVHTPAMLTIFIATLCGIFDFSATRFSILALSRSHGLCREIVVASPGILVSFIVAGVVTPPVVLRMFPLGDPPGSHGIGPSLWDGITRLLSQSTGAQVSASILFVFFLAVELLPVAAKIISDHSAPTEYDFFLAAEETRVKQQAEVQRMEIRRRYEAKVLAGSAIDDDMRQRETELGIHANEIVIKRMQELLDAALQDWSARVQVSMADALTEGGTPDAAKLSDFARQGREVIHALRTELARTA